MIVMSWAGMIQFCTSANLDGDLQKIVDGPTDAYKLLAWEDAEEACGCVSCAL